MITKITAFYIRTFTDNGQTVASAEWVDHKGKRGRTSGRTDNPHMNALFLRSRREGVAVIKEKW